MTSAGNHTTDKTALVAPGEAIPLPDDTELLEQIGQGNHAAFRALTERHAPYLFGIARSLTGNSADAEDLVQDTFIGALEGRFRGESSVRTWLVRILVNRAAMFRRSRWRGGAHTARYAESVAENTPSASAGVDAKLDLAAMLDQLSTEHRQVIILRELQGLSYDEMARTLGVPRGTVESRLHRAREELSRHFKESRH